MTRTFHLQATRTLFEQSISTRATPSAAHDLAITLHGPAPTGDLEIVMLNARVAVEGDDSSGRRVLRGEEGDQARLRVVRASAALPA